MLNGQIPTYGKDRRGRRSPELGHQERLPHDAFPLGAAAQSAGP
jgi:hypothetical protein